MKIELKQKYSLVLVIMLLLQFLPYTTYGIEGYTSHPVYEGMENGRNKLDNFRYKDVAGHWARVPIYEMAGLSLMRGTSETNFSPNSALTYLEAITVLVRAIGKEAEAQQLGQMEAPANVRDLLILSAVHNWGKGSVQVALNQGIITPQEVDEIINLTPQQQTNLENQIQTQLDRFPKDNYTEQELADVEAQINESLENTAIWNRPVPRQQVAVWVARALGLQPTYGENIIKTYNFDDWREIDPGKIPLIEALIQKGHMNGVTPQLFAPRGHLTRGQMAQLMFNINGDLLEVRGLTQRIGRVTKIEEIQQQGKPKKVFTILNDDHSQNYLTSGEGANRDFLVQKNGAISLSELLEKGDSIYYFINQKQEVIYARVVPTNVTTLEGFIDLVDVENNRLALTDFEDQKHLMELPSFTLVTVNGRQAKLQDLIYGQEIKVTLKQGTVVEIDGYLEEDPNLHGYIPPGSKVKVGEVLFINANEVELRVGSEREKYRILPNTLIARNGKVANLIEVKPGDRVILSFDDIYNPDIAEIRVEDDERHITDVFRGTLESVSERNKEMIINTITEFKGETWTPHPQQKVKIKVEDYIYLGGEKISLRDLSKHIGKELYTAVESSYGTQRAAKVVLKDGSTQHYENKVTGLQFGNNRMVVENNAVFFNPGTIIVKNNRLVDVLNLENSQTIYLAADLKQGTRNAAFVSIQYDGMMDDRIDGTRLVVYRGRIESMGDYSLTLGRLAYQMDYLKLQDHKWTEIVRPIKLTLSEDTYIFDSEIKQEVESSYFLGSRFINPDLIQDPALRNRIKNNHYIGKSAFILALETTHGGQTTAEILALNLTPNHLNHNHLVNTNHSAIAEIQSVDLDTNKMTLTNLRHWNPLTNRWETAGSQETVSMEKAVILVNDKPISREDFYKLKERAKVYLIKSKNVSTQDDAYIVVVEQ